MGHFTGTDSPGPEDGWGTPELDIDGPEEPSTCDEQNIVHYDSQGTELELTGGVHGCGILLVEGDLKVSGGFTWHGVVITTGSVTYTGGGEKNVTGAILAGGSISASIEVEDDIGGNSNIIYCSTAINNQTQNRALRYLSINDNLDGN